MTLLVWQPHTWLPDHFLNMMKSSVPTFLKISVLGEHRILHNSAWQVIRAPQPSACYHNHPVAPLSLKLAGYTLCHHLLHLHLEYCRDWLAVVVSSGWLSLHIVTDWLQNTFHSVEELKYIFRRARTTIDSLLTLVPVEGFHLLAEHFSLGWRTEIYGATLYGRASCD